MPDKVTVPKDHYQQLQREAAQRDRLLEAMRQIEDMKPEPHDDGVHHPADCAECAKWRERKHPIQHACDGWYRAMRARDSRESDAYRQQMPRMRDIARAAIKESS